MKRNASLPPVLGSKLAHFRRRVWIIKMTEGLLAAFFGLALSYLSVLVLDRFFETPAWLRALLLLAGAAVPGLGLPLKWHYWVWRQRRLEDAARLLRWKFPRLSDRLLGIVELARHDGEHGHSERLVQAAMGQAEESVRELDFSDAVPRASHRRWACAVLGIAALIGASALLMSEAARNALVRWLTPWEDHERFTFTRVEGLPDPLVVPEAEPFELPVNLSKSSRWKPRNATAHIPQQDRVSAARSGASYTLSFPPQKKDREVFVKVGDARKRLQLQPRPRPELTTLNVRLRLPDYLEYQSQPEMEVRAGTVAVVRGAQAVVEATASRDLAKAFINGKAATVQGDRLTSAPLLITEARELTFRWEDVLGLSPQSPLILNVQPAEDEAPSLVARRDSLEQVVLDSELITFDITASDDFGIRRIGLQWSGLSDGGGNGSRTEGSKVVAAGAPEKKELGARATFSAKREGIQPQSIEVRAWAEDFMPGREPSHSAVFILHVLNPEEHAMWVTQQMARWLEAARETYEREQQLHATNKELRELSPAELDRPDTRQRIAMQASAETANAERLAALTTAGRKLVEHATKNDEFDAARLESWALMLRMLDEISRQRMPGVADLLKRAADAETGGKALAGNQPAQPGSPGIPSDGQGSGEGGTSQSAQSQPASGQGQSGTPGDAISAPTLGVGPSPPKSGGPQEGEAPESAPSKSDPSIALKESSMFKPKAGDPQPAGGGGAASLTLPTNSLAPPPMKFRQPAPSGSAAANLDQGIAEQRDLLAEFAKVADQLNEILLSLESSTFVKRFKAASRRQTELAGQLGERSLEGFGIARANPNRALHQVAARPPAEPTLLPEPESKSAPTPLPGPEDPQVPFVTTYAPLASRQARSESQVVRVILTDLEAYFQRRADLHVKKVLDEMKETRVVRELSRVGQRAADNYSGNAIHAAELWADTMDRWAEEMVSIGKAFC